jgi:hypothetical protein
MKSSFTASSYAANLARQAVSPAPQPATGEYVREYLVTKTSLVRKSIVTRLKQSRHISRRHFLRGEEVY